MIRHKFVYHNQSALHYARAGDGERAMLVFHGFGQDMSVFEHLTRSLASRYSFYVFDLYFHGRSRWAHEETTLGKTEWRETMAIFLRDNGIEKFSVAGFSLGGKFALATVEAFPQLTDQVFLIAPDGIKTSFWYSLATYPFALRKFFKSMILRPERFLALARLLNQSGLVDKGLIWFAEYQMNSEEKRRRVYYTWVVFRRLHFDLPALAAKINQNNIDVTIIVGAYDKIITPANMSTFAKKLRRCRIEILPSGHSGLINLCVPYLIKQ